MRVTWVLSEQERERRFSKNKKKSRISKKSVDPNTSVMKGPSLNFSVDERFIMEDIHTKFEVAWLENFIVMNRSTQLFLMIIK